MTKELWGFVDGCEDGGGRQGGQSLPLPDFQTVPKLYILVHFLVFVLAGGLFGPDESCYRS